MNAALSQLHGDLPGFDPLRLKRLQAAGFVTRAQIEDLVRGDPNGVALLTTCLEISHEKLQRLMGWTEIPSHCGVTLTAPCPLGGVLGAEPVSVSLPCFARMKVRSAKRPLHFNLLAHYQPLQNQGSAGTCTAFATGAVLEGQRTLADHSEAFIY